MKQFRHWVFLISVATILNQTSKQTYSAMEPDEPVDAPARVEAPTSVPGVNRKPAVEPRVYIEDAASETGYTYYDYADQTPTQEQRPPKGSLENN